MSEPTYLTPEEFEKKMLGLRQKYLIELDDEEEVHIYMDNLMCSLLIALGYGTGVEVFKKTKKWYA